MSNLSEMENEDLLEPVMEDLKEEVIGSEANIDDSGVTIPLTEDMIKEGIANYEKSILDSMTPEKVEEFKKTIEDFYQLAVEHNKFIQDKFSLNEYFPNYELTFDSENEVVKKYVNEIRPVINFLTDKEILDNSYLDKVSEAADLLYRSELLSMVMSEHRAYDQRFEQLHEAIYHGAISLSMYQVEEALRSLMEMRVNKELTETAYTAVIERVNHIYDVHIQYLDHNGLNPEVLNNLKKQTSEILTLFKLENN